MNNDTLFVLSGYLDLSTYKILQPIYPKIFKNYQKLKKEYSQYFADQIHLKWKDKFEFIQKLNKKSATPKTKFFFLLCQYQAITELVYALEYCDIFSVKTLDIDIDLHSSDLESQNKCILQGYFLDNQLFDGEVKISSEMKSGYHNMFASQHLKIITDKKTYFLDINNDNNIIIDNNLGTSELDNNWGISVLDIIVDNPLFRLYSKIYCNFTEIFSISFDSINKITNSAMNSIVDRNVGNILGTLFSMGQNLNTWTTLDKKELISEYSDIDEIIKFRKGIN